MHTSYRLGLIGYPLEHSYSPAIHHAALSVHDLHGEYRLYPLSEERFESTFAELLTALRTGRLHGLNVTLPYKQRVIPFLDGLTPIAQAIGAVNTLLRMDGQIIGHNTDALGFYHDLLRCWRRSQREIPHDRPRHALLLGNGGSARAIAYILATRGWQVTVAARCPARCQEWRFGHTAIPWEARTHLPACDLLVNCTPLGMTPHTDTSPWPEEVPLPADALVYDLVYNPEETRLLHQARAQGRLACSGLGMLVEQAALAFECWTGYAAPREVMAYALRNHRDTHAASLSDRR